MNYTYEISTYDNKEIIHCKQIKKSSKEKPLISIIIRCKNEEEKIKECLEKILNQEINKEFEIIIIDSGSSDKTISIAKKYDVNIYTIPENEFNFGSSIQLGIKLSKGKYCTFLSAHCIPVDKKWLNNLTRVFDENTAATYGKQTYYDDTYFIEKKSLSETFKNTKKTQKWNKKFKNFKDYKNEIIFSNANSCIRKDIAEKIPFRNLIASEDREWAYRVLKNNYIIKYVPDSIVYHAHNETKEKYYQRIYINSKALYCFQNVHINLIHVIPLYLVCISSDLKYLVKNKLMNFENIKMSLIYRFMYVKAHYDGSRK